MDRGSFAQLLADRVLLADGGTGTSLLERGAAPDACADLLNIQDRDLVRDVHASFVEAGAQIIETNTFGANRYRLGSFGAENLVEEVNLAGVARAREAGAEIVAGSVGPLGVRLAPYGRVAEPAAAEAFAEQIGALVRAGVDLLLLETFSDLSEALVALRVAREVGGDLAVAVTMTFTRDDRTLLGEPPWRIASELAAAGADALGANCSEGPEQVLRVLSAMAPHAHSTPLIAQPNAGGPQHSGGRTLYSAAPEYTARYMPAFVEVGARIIGGCCGTRPRHIAMAAAALASAPSDAVRVEVFESEEGPAGTTPVEQPPSRLAAALAAGQRVITVEMEPPHGPSLSRMIAAAETLRDAGATTVNIADSPRAQLRMAPWAAAHLIQTEARVETILHFPTRGRNLLRIQSDLLAAHALGLRNLFAVMGDPVSTDPGTGDLSEVTPSGLIALIAQRLNAGSDGSGATIGEPTRFTVGCAVDPNAADLEREARVLRRKIEAGAAFALTQPVYEPKSLERLVETYRAAYGDLTLPLILGSLPLVGARHAEFLHNEVPGIEIPEAVRDRLTRANDPRAEGMAIARETIEATSPWASGVYLIPAFRRYDAVAELIEHLT
ncbi:MAG: bifunctional homocysteine S-methyltransferase/methylenetetrahydrofolate reductase [Actinomycetota bacterium]